MSRIMQQFQNSKSNQEDKTDHDPQVEDSEKKINERMNKMEEMIRRARKMEELMDYDSPYSPMQSCHPSSRCQS